MCLALPMRITAVDGAMATIVAEGLEQRCSVMLVPQAEVGDYVLVHAGFAINLVDEAEARGDLSSCCARSGRSTKVGRTRAGRADDAR